MRDVQKSSEILISNRGRPWFFPLWLFLVRALFADPCLGTSRSETFDVCCIYIYRHTFTEVCRKDHSFLQISPKQSIEYHVCCLNPHEIPLAIPVVDGYNPINPYGWWLQILWNPCLRCCWFSPCYLAHGSSAGAAGSDKQSVKYEDFTDFIEWSMVI